MKTHKLLSISTIILLTAALASCASYSASPLCKPYPDLVQSAPQSSGVSVVSKAFTKQDCDKFLDRDVISEGYQPVQLFIQNSSENTYIFSLNRIGLPIARPEEVAEKVHTSTAGRAAGYGAAAVLTCGLFAIPAIVDGVKSSNANTALDNDFAAKAARDQVIFPHSHMNAIIFVPVGAYQDSYTLTLIDQGSNRPKIFNIVSAR